MSSQLSVVISMVNAHGKESMRQCQSLVIIFFPEETVASSSSNPIF